MNTIVVNDYFYFNYFVLLHYFSWQDEIWSSDPAMENN